MYDFSTILVWELIIVFLFDFQLFNFYLYFVFVLKNFLVPVSMKGKFIIFVSISVHENITAYHMIGDALLCWFASCIEQVNVSSNW